MKGRNVFFPLAMIVLVCAFLTSSTAADQILKIDGQARSMGPHKTVPAQLNYQGSLANAADSAAVNATLEMTYRIYDSETDGTELWSETHPAVLVADGLFQVLMGSMTPFPAGLFDGSALWLQTEVGTEVLTPRKPLVSAAYSQRAERADHAATADWATDAQNAVRADTADHCPGLSSWTVSGDDVYRLTGKVGIGTDSPLTELDVAGSVNADTYYGDGSNLTGISGTADDDWTIDGDDIYHETGDVGIGTTTPDRNLHIYDDVNNIIGIKLENINTEGMSREGITFADENGSVAGIVTYDDNSTPPNAMRIYNNRTGGVMTFWTGSVERVRLTNDGKFGIGISTPSQTLDVDGAVSATTYYGDGSNLTGISGTTDNDWTIDGDNIYHETGDVGIGTSSPSEKLHVQGTVKAVAASGPHYIIHDSNGSNDRPGIQFTNNSIHFIGGDDLSDEYFGFYSLYNSSRSYDAHLRVHGKAASDWGSYIDLTHDGTDAVISTDAGDIVLSPAVNVGIGTNSPAEKLVIQGGGPKLALNTTNTSATALYFQESGSSKWSIAYAPGSDYLYFYDFTKGGTRMVLKDGTGYVGIRTASPTAPLDVNGTARADTVKVDHDLVVTGAYKGTIGPNDGAPFPRPAYDSGWQSIDAGVPLGIVHDVGGDINDYVIDMQVNGSTSNRYLDSDEIYWDSLTATSMAVYRVPGNTTISTVRIRIWMYN